MAEEKVVDTDDEALLKVSREGLSERISAESDQRALMLDDLKFSVLDQWPSDIRAARENDVVNGPRPCLTVDQINQYITQVSNDMLKNRPSVKPRPVDSNADVETADIYAGIIRHIEDRSNAKIAYQSAGDSAVTIGLGFFRIVPQYVDDKSHSQELIIKRVPDTFSVYLGHHIMPDGSDAEKGWVLDTMPMETFKREFPKAKVEAAHFDGLGTDTSWRTDDTITVCEYFYKKYTPATSLFLGDGRTLFEEEYAAMPEPRPQVTGRRETHKVVVMWCKHSGCEVLDKREMKGKYIPIIEVVGKEKIVEGKRLLWGLVRPAKDSLRAFNYWISALTEKMALSPKAPFIGAVGQFKSQGDRWDKANVNNYAKLEYDAIDVNGNAVPPPRRQEPMQMEPAMVQMIQMMQNNVKSSLGMYKAALGETESQQSGRAILALQKESDTGTMHFGENQSIAVTHCGRILIDLIPYYYDTKGIVRILGEDGKPQSVEIDPQQKQAARKIVDDNGKTIKTIFNLGVGTYDVVPTTGPSYTTSRQEASTVMNELANSAKDPVSAAILRYGTIKNSDFAGSEEITKMLKLMLPPQLQQTDGEQGEIPPEAMQKIAQMQQAGQMMQQKLQEQGQELVQAKAGVQEGMAKIQADGAAKAEALRIEDAAQKEKQRLAREQFEFDKALEIDKANHAIDLEERKAKAVHAQKSEEMAFNQQCYANEESVKRAEQVRTEEVAAVPNFTKALEQIVRAFAQMHEQQQQVLLEIAQAQNKPKTITAKSSSGMTMSATVQ